MPTSVVVGAFQFIGFHLAKFLLDQGEEVIGIDWEDVSMEKEMEFGRNSNFLYIPINRLHHVSVVQPKTIYISGYDLTYSSIKGKQTIIQHITTFLKTVEVHHDSPVILMLPNEEDQSIFDPLLQRVHDSDTAKLVHLPTIYGPWQPETMSFEAAIRQKELLEIEKMIMEEDRSDAIFISDIMDIVIQIVSHHEKKIQLQSKAPDQWQQCAKQLWNDEWISQFITNYPSRTTNGFVYKVVNKTNPIEGISLQKKHVQLLKKWRELD